MSLKLDDLLLKKKEAVQILDLSKSTANTKEELRKLLEKVPEFKIKIEKVKAEDVKIHDRRFTFRTSKKELKQRSFPFSTPTPIEMKSVCLDDLCTIPIQWKMLTSLRPKSKLDEEYYSKLVELGKSQMASREKEKTVTLSSFTRKSKNKAGVLETTIVCCRACGEEFCSSETCRQVAYDQYERENISKPNDPTDPDGQGAGEQFQGKKRKRKTAMKSKIKKRGKATTKMSARKTSSSKFAVVEVKVEKKQQKSKPFAPSLAGSKARKSTLQRPGKKKPKRKS